MQINNRQKRVWAEIDMDALGRNFGLARSLIKKETKLCCVIKANAYGHGAVESARLFEQLGADMLAVSNIEEALQLRRGGIKVPVLILGYTPAECAGELIRNDITQCVYSREYGAELSRRAQICGGEVKIHIKIDTGMGRIGFVCRRDGDGELLPAYDVCKMDGLCPVGIFTHFAEADDAEGENFTRLQYSCFEKAVKYLENKGIRGLLRHCSNSAAILDYPEYNLDMVRAGAILYGLKPSDKIKNPAVFEPVMTLKSVISHVKTVLSGDSVSYGRTFVADKTMKIATVPIGYADGFLRSNSTAGTKLLIGGKSVRLLGRVCMDQVLCDAGGLDGISIGDEITVFGKAPAMTADEIAALNGTVGYEVLCAVGERVPRVYIKGGEVVSVSDGIVQN